MAVSSDQFSYQRISYGSGGRWLWSGSMHSLSYHMQFTTLYFVSVTMVHRPSPDVIAYRPTMNLFVQSTVTIICAGALSPIWVP